MKVMTDMATARMRLEDFHLISWAESSCVSQIKYAANLMGIRLVSFCLVSLPFPSAYVRFSSSHPAKTIYPAGILALALIALEVGIPFRKVILFIQVRYSKQLF